MPFIHKMFICLVLSGRRFISLRLLVVQECWPCHEICDGCFNGATSRHCIKCTAYTEEDDCVESCSDDFYADELAKTCNSCDDQCEMCRGATAADCISCRSLKLYNDVEGHTADTPVSALL